jgi:hypothetical protein
MTKKLLLNLINGVLLVSFCNMGKAVGAVSSSHREERDFPISEKKVMKKEHSGDRAKKAKGLESEPQKSKKSTKSIDGAKAKGFAAFETTTATTRGTS